MISIFIRTIIIYILLTVLMKIMGKRRIGELEAGELVSTLLISEIAAMPIGDGDLPLLSAIIPVLFICALEVGISAIKNKSRAIKLAVEGECSYIIYKGRLLQDELEKNRLSINEVLSEMRAQGVADISAVYYAILEPNGKLSLVTNDKSNEVSHAIVIDGKTDEKKLKRRGYNQKWLERVLSEGNTRLEEVFLLTVKEDGSVSIIKKDGAK